MKAAIMKKAGEIKIKEVEIRSPGAKEVLVKVKASGICGTDYHIYAGKAPAKFPLIPGHEIAGKIEEVGTDIYSLVPGDKVAINPNIHCGHCFFCRRGSVNLCSNLQAVGVTRDGGFGEFVKVPVTNVYKLPTSVDYEVGAMVEPISCCLHGIDLAKIKTGDNVVILGGGAIGLILAQLARNAGAKNVIISEPDRSKKKIAHSMDFKMVISPEKVNDELSRLSVPGADIVIEAVGKGETIKQALQLVRKGGTCVFFGVCPEQLEVPLSPFAIYRNEITIKGSYINPFVTERAIKLLDKLEIKKLITDRFSLEELVDILNKKKEENMKAIVIFN